MKRCTKAAWERCPYREYCEPNAQFEDGSACDRFNQRFEKGAITYADHIRDMTDKELAEWLMQLESKEIEDALPYCTDACGEQGLETDEITHEMCRNCLVKKLQQPYESPTGKKG